ncbi:hypothetical protein LLG95_08240 [bacterium]|nr:hypothetical protein [bacterium]
MVPTGFSRMPAWMRCVLMMIVFAAAGASPRAFTVFPYFLNFQTPNIDETSLNIDKHIYVLRHYVFMTRLRPWAESVAELIRIGELAVPNICGELMRDNSAASQSALMMTLRAIGDKRAVPALIRRLEMDVPPGTADVGRLCTGDAELDVYLKQFGLDKFAPENMFALGRPITELCLALESLTGHSEGYGYLYYKTHGAIAIEQAEIEFPDLIERQRNAARRWRAWWEANKTSILGPAQIAQAEAWANPVWNDPVEDAGMVAFGPMIPTGPGIVFKRAIEVTLYLWRRAGDVWSDFGIDFDRGMPVSCPSRLTDPASRAKWSTENGLDAVASTVRLADNDPEAPAHDFASLGGCDCLVWSIENSYWETIENDLRFGELRVGDPEDGFGDCGTQYPRTYLIRTRENGFGIVQILGYTPDQHKSGVRIRFKMIGTENLG